MVPSLEEVDTAVIEELSSLKSEREVLAGRLERMEKDRDKVSQSVFERVQGDYAQRLSQLEERAVPLKDRARQEHDKLQELLATEESAEAAARLDREETELRHDLGEYDKKARDKRISEIDKALATHEKALAAMRELHERFAAAFDSSEELETPDPDEPDEPSPTPAPEAVAGEEQGAAEIARTEAEEPEADPDLHEEVTGPVGTLSPAADKPAASAPARPAYLGELAPLPPAPLEGALEGATVILNRAATPPVEPDGGHTVLLPRPAARLVPVDAGLGVGEYPLGPLTTVGRTSQNQVQVAQPAVSRHHAQISLTENGYQIKDLGSENGTYVNGERIEERLLADGDRVQIGTARFEFHTQ